MNISTNETYLSPGKEGVISKLGFLGIECRIIYLLLLFMSVLQSKVTSTYSHASGKALSLRGPFPVSPAAGEDKNPALAGPFHRDSLLHIPRVLSPWKQDLSGDQMSSLRVFLLLHWVILSLKWPWLGWEPTRGWLPSVQLSFHRQIRLNLEFFFGCLLSLHILMLPPPGTAFEFLRHRNPLSLHFPISLSPQQAS